MRSCVKIITLLLVLFPFALSASPFFETGFWRKATPEAVQKQINKGFDVNARDEEGWTPLIEAATWGKNAKALIPLLENGADVNAQDNEGWTALMAAEKFEMVAILLKYGAKVNMRNNEGWTALMLAEDNGDSPKIINLLIKNGAKK